MKNSVGQFLFGASQFFKTNPRGEAYQGVFPKQHLQALFYAKKELEKKEGETEENAQKKSEERIEKINQTLSAFASNPSEEAQPNYPDPVVKIINDYQQLASDRASGAVAQEQLILRQGNLNQSFNSFVDRNPAPLSGLISAVGQKVVTKVATKAAAGALSKVAAAAAGIVNPILGAIVGFVSKELISKAIEWLNRNKKRVLQILGGALAIGGLLVGGVGGALALGTGVVFIGAGAVGVQGINGAISSGVNAIGQFTTTIGISVISSLTVVLIIAIAAVPVLIGFILFIINSGAYVVPAVPGISQACIPSGAQVTPASGGVYKIMPLGDSITAGYVPPNHASEIPPSDQQELLKGYREKLLNQLTSAGYKVDFVGSVDGPATHHEGHPNRDTGYLLSNLDGWLSQNTPDIVLLHAGTVGVINVDTNVANIGKMIEKIKAKNPNAKILLAKIIIQNGAYQGQSLPEITRRYNSLLAQKYGSDSNVVIVDMESQLSANQGDYSDAAHPSIQGYEKMAKTWFSTLQGILGATSGLANAGNLPVCPTGCPAEMWPVTTDDGSKYYIRQGPGGKASHGPPATVPVVDPLTHKRTGERKPVPYLEAIDITPQGGNAKNGLILITHPGVVKVAQVDNYGGNFVEVLDTCSGGGGTFRTMYVHMRPPLQVKTGDTVGVGTVVGKIGMTGYATGIHLHYEFLKPNGYVRADPSRKVPPFMTIPYIPKDVPQFCLQDPAAEVHCNVDIP